MVITLKRQLSDDEKERVLEIHGRKCFATGHDISENESVHFDHIKAFADGGISEINNIAPMCETHNQRKGTLALYDFKIKLKITEFFKRGDSLTLKDELEFLKEKKEISEFGNPINIIDENDENDENIEIEMDNIKRNFHLHKCPVTGWYYFYATLDVNILDSDDDEDNEIGLQPRYLIFEKVFNLFRHLQNHPVLQPSLCRLHNDKILVFDGQHKIAALLWGGRTEFECKVYVSPDPTLLNKTNISAHDKYAQTRFFSSVMVAKLGSQFGKEFDNYKNQEDGEEKSEKGFYEYLKDKEKLTTGEANKRFRSFLYHSILDDERNQLQNYVSKGNRSTSEKPITIDMLHKSLFSVLLYREPVEHDMATEKYMREYEFDNVIDIFNMLYEEALCGWDGSRPNTDTNQNKLNRLFRSKSIMAWSELFRDSVCAKLKTQDTDLRQRPLYRNLTEADKEDIRFIIRRLVEWTMWEAPVNSEIDTILANNKKVIKNFFREKGLTTGYLMGAPE